MKKLFISILLICMFCTVGCTVKSRTSSHQSGFTSTTYD